MLKSTKMEGDSNIVIKGYLGYIRELKRYLLKKWKHRTQMFKKFRERSLLQPSLALYFNSFKAYRARAQNKLNKLSLASSSNRTRLKKKYYKKMR